MKGIINNAVVFKVVIVILSCNQLQKKETAVASTDKQETRAVPIPFIADTFPVITVSKETIGRKSFELKQEEMLYSAMDSQQVIIGGRDRYYSFYPASGIKADLDGLNSFLE